MHIQDNFIKIRIGIAVAKLKDGGDGVQQIHMFI
jgi:hypothetical protein